MSPAVTVTHADATTDTIAETIKWSDKSEIGKMRKAEITVERSAAQAANLQPVSDEISVTLRRAFTGPLVDIKKGGSTWTLVAYSKEWYGNTVTPTDGGTLKSDTDNALVEDFINDVPEWSIGTVNSQTAAVDFVFNHAFPHEAIRRIEQNTPGEAQFNADGSVDYTDRLGSDKSASITLSSAQGNLNNEINITDRSRDLDGTHFRLIGAHEGEAQLFANIVPSGDTTAQNNLEHVVTYTSPRWSDSDDTEWSRRSNTDLMSQSAVDEAAAALGEEIKESYVEAKATVEGEDLAIGDTVHVEKPDADLDRDFRIHRIRTVGTGAKVVDKVLLSTRTVARQDETKTQRDISRYNVAFQGSSVILQGGGARQPVNAAVNAFESFRYPNVNFEHVAEVEVRGLPYRAYSSGAAAGGDHSHLVAVTHPSHSHDVNIGTKTSDANTEHTAVAAQDQDTSLISPSAGWQIVFDTGVFLPEHEAFIGHFYTHNQNEFSTMECRLVDGNGNTFPGSNGIFLSNPADSASDPKQGSATITIPKNNAGGVQFQVRYEGGSTDSNVTVGYQAWGTHTHDVNIGTETSSTALGTSIDETSDASGDHTHPVDPGLSEFGTETPSNVDLLVNGATVASNIGSGTFTTVVDVTSDFNQGQWNDIEATSDSLGHITLRPYVETYKQIGKL